MKTKLELEAELKELEHYYTIKSEEISKAIDELEQNNG